MPIHDWTRVSPGTFHDFHCSWIAEIRNCLNTELLPRDFYARIRGASPFPRLLDICRSSDDRRVAMLWVVSPRNKANHQQFRIFVEKAVKALSQGCHLVLIDLFPSNMCDQQTIHGAICAERGEDLYIQPQELPLTLVSYATDSTITPYIQPCAVGDTLTSMPLFLTPSYYVSIPLEECYQAAYRGMPRRWRDVLEAESPNAD